MSNSGEMKLKKSLKVKCVKLVFSRRFEAVICVPTKDLNTDVNAKMKNEKIKQR